MIINVNVNNKIATLEDPAQYLVCGNNDYIVNFTFDEEWQQYAVKTARFVWNNQYIDVVFSGSECNVPIINNTLYVAIGVYAGNLHTTTPAIIAAKKSIMCNDPIHVDPPEDVYNQLIEMIRHLDPPESYVESINGKTGEVTLTAADVHALPDSTIIPTVPVQSVNNKTGNVVLTAADVHALPDNTIIPDVPVQSVNNKTGDVVLTAADVHALPDTTIIPTVPVQSVNGQTGDVELTAADVGAVADDTEIVNRINNKTGNVTIGAADVGALPDDTFIPDVYVEKINNKTGVVTLTAADVHALPEDTTIPVVPSVVSAFTNDAGYLTQHQDISGLSLITETGNKISLSIDTVNYVLTLSLLDKNGNALDTKTVDFPLESVVVGGRFDAAKKEIVLTLQSGESISFPVADLIAGLESTSNKTTVINDNSTDTQYPTAKAVNDKINDIDIPVVPSVVSAFTNDAGYITEETQPDWNAASGVAAIANKPSLAAVATSGSYNDLDDKPTIPAAQVNSDWDAVSGKAQILNKPTLADVATSGSYNDLSNKPTIPAAQVNSDWNATSGKAQILNKPTLATVATSGSYNDLSNKPTIPAAQVNSDWNATSGKAQILNKPSNVVTGVSAAYKIRALTQAEYNAITSKDGNTIYLITG